MYEKESVEANLSFVVHKFWRKTFRISKGKYNLLLKIILSSPDAFNIQNKSENATHIHVF